MIRMRQYAVSLAAVLLLSACGKTGSESDLKLTGGKEVKNISNFPGVVLIQGSCTATKVGPRHILTAAHCVLAKGSTELKPIFWIGGEFGISHNVRPNSQGYDYYVIKDVHVHPSFREYRENCQGSDCVGNGRDAYDVAVVETRDNILNIPSMPISYETARPGDETVVMGYGCEEGVYAGGPFPPRLKIETTTVLSKEALDHPNGYLDIETRNKIGRFNVITAGLSYDGKEGPGASVCPGDSGAGLLSVDPNSNPRYSIIGINSYYSFLPGNDKSYTNFHARLSAVKNWLEASLAADNNGVNITVRASDTDNQNIAQNTLDGDFNTRWSARDNAWIEYDLGEKKLITEAQIAWFKGDERRAKFKIQTSNNQNSWKTVFDGESSGSSVDPEVFNFADSEARYLRILGSGNNVNNWNSITEVEIDFESIGNEISVKDVSASSFQAPNIPRNTLDGDISSRWSAEGSGQWIRFEFERSVNLSRVSIAWLKGDQRRSNFEIDVSSDGQNWFNMFTGSSSGSSLGFEDYNFTARPTRFVRIIGKGNSQNQWNSINEVDFTAQR